MSFAVAAALGIAALIAAPVAAHLLRKGQAKEQVFPATSLVPVAQPAARQRSRLQDRFLLLIRALMVLALALLGATPFVRCQRLALTRDAGGSVAIAIVVDDSLSMRGVVSGQSRWRRAKEGARDLLDSTREGDAVALVAAGRPARLVLGSTTDLLTAQKALEEINVSDRSTDLAAAVNLARAALKPLPHRSKRIVLLSDLAGGEFDAGTTPISTPIKALWTRIDDCGIVSARRRGRAVSVEVACTATRAARGRELVLRTPDGKALDATKTALAPRSGVQTLSVPAPEEATIDVALTGTDSLKHDDTAPVADQTEQLTIAVVTDAATSSTMTGGPTVVEQALTSLEAGISVKALTVMPTESSDLKSIAGLIIDDPSGLSPETRRTLTEWATRGGVALALLGPKASTAQLGSNMEPFAQGAATWEPTELKGPTAQSLGWLNHAETWSDIRPEGRAMLQPAAKAATVGKWPDGVAFATEQSIGRGLLLALGLPARVDLSDLALRPAFLALLDHLTAEAKQRSDAAYSKAGATWSFPAADKPKVAGPAGPQKVESPNSEVACPPHDQACRERMDATRVLVAALRGRYEITARGSKTVRIVGIDAEEILTKPKAPDEVTALAATDGARGQVDVSRQIALLLLLLLALELGARALTPRREIHADA